MHPPSYTYFLTLVRNYILILVVLSLSLYKQLPAMDLFKLLPPPWQTFLCIFPRLSCFRPSTIRQTTSYLPGI